MRVPSTIALLVLLSSAASGQSWTAEVNRAIDRGVHALVKRQRPDGSFEAWPHERQYPMGTAAMALYALLNSGLSPDDPAVGRALRHLRGLSFRKTYGTALLILALDSLKDPRQDDRIRKAARWLEENFDRGSGEWGYPEGHPDLSNTQYGALGLWTAARHGYQARRATWARLASEVEDLQNADGGFGYRDNLWPRSTASMTTAGLTVLHLAGQRLGSGDRAAACRKVAEQAWDWLEGSFTAGGNVEAPRGLVRDRRPGANNGATFHHYYLYGLERVAAFAERSRIAGRDWYREGALHLLRFEKPEGGWGDLANTCFALLFLRRVTWTHQHGGTRGDGYPPAMLWRHTAERPPEGWQVADFDDRAWKLGAAAFGKRGHARAAVRTVWNGSDLWLRHEFRWSKGRKLEHLWVLNDDGCEIWINGVTACRIESWSQDYVRRKVSAEARAALVPGRNVIAVHVNDIGGARVLDVRFADHHLWHARRKDTLAKDRRLWWRADLPDDASPVCSWLVAGPLQDRKGELFHQSLMGSRAKAPAPRSRSKAGTFRLVHARDGRLDLGRAARAKDGDLALAFTAFDVPARLDAVLWLACTGGVRVSVDGNCLLAYPGRPTAERIEHRLPVRLEPGRHGVLLQVASRGTPARLDLVLTDREGRPVPGLVPSPSGVANARDARLHPALLAPGELFQRLPEDRKRKLDLSSSRDRARLAVGPQPPGWPRWFTRPAKKAEAPRPPPGARGLLALALGDETVPVDVTRRMLLPSGRPRLDAAWAPSAATPPGDRPSLRIGVYDGRWHWLANDAEKKPTAWRRASASLEAFAGRSVLLVLRFTPAKKAAPVTLWLDRFSIAAR